MAGKSGNGKGAGKGGRGRSAGGTKAVSRSVKAGL